MVQDVVRHSWGRRIRDSIKGILFGLVCFLGSFVLLWWNEGLAVRDYKTLNEVRDAAVPVPADTLQPANEGKPVHLSARAETTDVLKDEEFGIEANAIRLDRHVEMYQWKEREETTTRKKLGGSTETVTTYTYDKVWSGQVINSQSFREASQHPNPQQMGYEDNSEVADQVTLGAFNLDKTLIRDLNFHESLTPRNAKLPEGASVSGSYVYVGPEPSRPQVGDVRISFQIVPQDTISVIAQQAESTLIPWVTSTGRSYFRIQRGEHALPAMLEQAKGEVRTRTWLIRFGGWFLMTLGLSLIFRPLAVLGDVVPMVGRLIGGATTVVAGVLSVVMASITIAIAWIAVRPMVGIPLLVLALALIVWLWKRSRKPVSVATPSAGMPPPPPPPPPPPAPQA